MAQKDKGRRRTTSTALALMNKPPTSDIHQYTTLIDLRQGPIDAVAIIAARARVALPTARLHSELFGFGGAHG